MNNALDHLGYHTYHMSECIKHWQDRHLHYWDEALKVRRARETVPSQRIQQNIQRLQRKFNMLLSLFQTAMLTINNQQAVSDIPSILLWMTSWPRTPKQKSSSPIETLTGGSSRWTVHSTQL